MTSRPAGRRKTDVVLLYITPMIRLLMMVIIIMTIMMKRYYSQIIIYLGQALDAFQHDA